MYIHSKKSRFKYADIALIDLIVMNIAFFLAYKIRNSGTGNPYQLQAYMNMLIVLCLSDLLAVSIFSSGSDLRRRGYYKEFIALLKQTAVIFVLGILYLYVVKDSKRISRISYGLMAVLYFALNYAFRTVWKKIVRSIEKKSPERSLLIITCSSNIDKAAEIIESSVDFSYRIAGFVPTDKDAAGTDSHKYPAVCTLEEVPEYVCHNWVDDVLIVADDLNSVPENILVELSETGVITHLGLSKIENMLGHKQFMENFVGYTVVTSCINDATVVESFLKRLMDIAGALVGCAITCVLFVILAPIIKIKSPGPVLFKQKRIGKNGRIFEVYKFRSMKVDAESEKKNLASSNRVAGGMMFKLDFDPRVIGNEILPDGTKKTGIGDFIRRTSLDEFPQFFNVLKGDMSLVGTRPPTVDELEKYDLHHRARLAIKPGLTGMWQISGRSDIVDFEEVVALDTKYINEWSLGKDIQILFKTIIVLFSRKGAM